MAGFHATITRMQRSPRNVTTADGVTHRVPPGITRNRVERCWTVAFRQRYQGTRSFSGANTRAALKLAVAELNRRRRQARAAGWVANVDNAERVGKAWHWGRPGVCFEARGGVTPRFTAYAERAGVRRKLAFLVRSLRDDDEILRAWSLAIAARDAMLERLASGRRWPVESKRIRADAVRRVAMIEADADVEHRVLRQVRAAVRVG